MDLNCLPVEILIQIANCLRLSDLSSLLRCSRKFKGVCAPILYRHVQLRVYGQYRKSIGKVFPLTLLNVESAEYFAEIRGLAVLGTDHHFGENNDDDRDTLVLNVLEKPITFPLVLFVKRIPDGNLQSFEFKNEFPVTGRFLIRILIAQPNLVNLYISFQNTTQKVTVDVVSQINLPNLKTLKFADIFQDTDELLLNRILGSASKLVSIDISWHPHYPEVNRSTHKTVFERILKHIPKTLKIANTDITHQLLDATGIVEELHLRDVSIPWGHELEYKNPHSSIPLKKLLITTIPDLAGFYQQQILDKLAPGLEELHFTVTHLDRDGETEIRENIPIPLEYVNRHSETMRSLSLFEKTSEGNFFIDFGPVCEDELEVFKSCRLNEFATAVNFYCAERTPGYWKTFDMSPIDVKYGHFAYLEKLYIIPDMISLNKQIKDDQADFWELNPRNILSYQMASVVLTNIALYAEKMPRLKFVVVGTGNAYCGQKVYMVSWGEHLPPQRRDAKEKKAKYLYTLSPPYDIEDFREQGVVFNCFEGTKFTSQEDRRWASIW
ncbi:hypothetical protein TWF718_009233 [Orbilia javanica]|uniref:F-box domain-containing protein n=1 Tax=Orbilia javanica TaxID=47235 RepID=A0AAN8MVI2_9PEZI